MGKQSGLGMSEGGCKEFLNEIELGVYYLVLSGEYDTARISYEKVSGPIGNKKHNIQLLLAFLNQLYLIPTH